ncbi:cytochrome P450 [Novosphingobium sp. B-7]|jgi:cytochrome P450|uniref:cytochrome P450 n=1 Tax=Novosphingobium sp. B-7 TaxID=1298855 RepID=UPI0009E2C78B|nr:cytochrome P450 [Novosphingobium sp. B-7]
MQETTDGPVSMAVLPDAGGLDLIGNVFSFEEVCALAFGNERLGLIKMEDGSVGVFRYEHLKALSENPEVGNTPANELIRWTLQHPEAANCPEGEAPGASLARWVSNQIFTANPPLHRPERMIIARQFVPRVIARLRPEAEKIMENIVKGCPEGEIFDLSRVVASKLSTEICRHLLDLTADEADRLGEAVDDMSQLFLLEPTLDQFASADRGAGRLIEVMCMAADRKMAAEGENLIKTMAAELALLDHKPDLDRTGMVPENIGLMLAANIFDAAHTTCVLASNVMYFILKHRDVYERLRADSSLISNAVSEGMRLAPPLSVSPRFTLSDVEYLGVLIPEGTKLLMMWEVGNRDPSVFEDPHAFILERKVTRDVTFGGGAHLCPGRHLARMLAEVIVGGLVSPRIELQATETDGLWVPNTMLRHLRELPVTMSRLPA